MKKKYVAPEMKITRFEYEDIMDNTHISGENIWDNEGSFSDDENDSGASTPSVLNSLF